MAERDQRLTIIFHSAIEREGAERRAFLDGACAGDEDLRREVESLIRSHEQAGSLIDDPAYERVAELLNAKAARSLAGRTLGQYRLVSLIGAGGMGEVYLAEDQKLNRRVAIKVLTSNLTSDAAQVRRFQQEARAASALNHPNIITVYEINEVDGRHYIASEYIEGETLRDRMSRSISSFEALDIINQVASALAAAHSAGVVHRDIKPENVMLRPDGYVKVLDFGIAKLTEQQKSSDQEAPTRALVQTGKGVVMGTAYYMSPEQARGQVVDARTDIWSLGVVLYELVTGKAPFQGDTISDCVASILKLEPVPVTEVLPDLPVRLDWVIQKALRKDREERYQTAKELLSDLRAVKQEVDNTRDLHVSNTSKATIASESIPASTADATRTTSSAEYIITEIKRHRGSALVVVGLLALVIAAGGYGIYKYRNREKPARPFFQNVEVSRITRSGSANEAAISPDGRYVVYVEGRSSGNPTIVLNQLATGNTLQIVPPTKASISGTVFSPDSTFVYYLMNDLSSDVTSLYQVPSIGGQSKKVLTDIDSTPTFSPDGKQIAFIRQEQNVKYDLVIANLDGSGERVLTTRQSLEWFVEEGPSWSPDGKTIASGAGSSGELKGGDIVTTLVGVDVATGAVRELSPKRWRGGIGRAIWMPDGSSIVILAEEHTTNDRPQIWRVAQPSGEATRVTNDVQSRGEGTLGVTSDGKTLISVTTQISSRIETLSVGGTVGKEISLTTVYGNEEGLDGLTFTPDGRIVYSSSEGSQTDLWIMNADGTNRVRLTSDKYWDISPRVSPDGRYIVFLTNRTSGGIPHVWRMDIDGTNPLELSKDEDSAPDISPDGRWVIYSSWGPGPQGVTAQVLRRVSIDGGPATQLTDYTAVIPTYSPDGKWIAITTFDDTVTPKRYRTAIIPADGGKPVKQFDRSNYSYRMCVGHLTD